MRILKGFLAVSIIGMSACAPMPSHEVSLEDCENGNSRCALCVDSKGEGDWYVDIDQCPKDTVRVFLKK